MRNGGNVNISLEPSRNPKKEPRDKARPEKSKSLRSIHDQQPMYKTTKYMVLGYFCVFLIFLNLSLENKKLLILSKGVLTFTYENI